MSKINKIHHLTSHCWYTVNEAKLGPKWIYTIQYIKFLNDVLIFKKLEKMLLKLLIKFNFK